MSRPSARRAGFTLVELLVVIAVIAILATISFGLFKAANDGRNKSKSKGEVQAIAMATQSYRKTYGDFPACLSGRPERFRRDLLDQLVGRRVMRVTTPGSMPTLLAFDSASLPGGTNRQMRSFLSQGDVTTNDDAQLTADDWRGDNAACREFVDAWGNAYDYRYRVLTPARFAEWKSPNYLLVSCSVNFNESTVDGEPPLAGEYWDPAPSGGSTMERSGIVPPTYFDESGSTGPFRADNIVNWAN
ncbi:MAG: prepilin-type N-terminal cleavage/methylation domain-containing protein [Verrucomicrobia bacterium]|jgi:prepilin-type N-terminal cleavage/methylation domain-containing protein|nr:MAG: prepilin-type N-terminal cleavage/methylation domain-containing protein [Verrucomicrobiota bacterium]